MWIWKNPKNRITHDNKMKKKEKKNNEITDKRQQTIKIEGLTPKLLDKREKKK